MARVLFISTSLPPVADSQTIRNVFLINGLLKAGHEVHLLQPSSETGDPTLEGMFVKGGWERTVTAQPLYDTLLASLQKPFLPASARHFLKRVAARSAGLVCVPDVRMGWGGIASRAAIAKFGHAPRPDIVISSSGSNTAHIAASSLARLWDRPWVAEFGDPWSLNPLPPARYFHIRLINRWLEERTLRGANAVVFTTSSTRDAFLRHFAGANRIRTTVVPCGFDSRLESISEITEYRKPEVVIAYTGTASRGSRNLAPLLALLQRAVCADESLPNVVVRLVGSVDPWLGRALSIGSRFQVENTGWRPYADSIDEIAVADGLLMIGNRSTLQVPAKLYNYMASRKPVLYLPQLPLDDDPCLDLLRNNLNAFVVNPEDTSLVAVRSFLASCAQSSGTFPHEPLRLRSWNRIGEDFTCFVEEVCIKAPAVPAGGLT